MSNETTVPDGSSTRKPALSPNRLGEAVDSQAPPKQEGHPHRLTREGVEYDAPDATRAPDMTEPILGGGDVPEIATPRTLGVPSRRSHEMNSLIGHTTRLQLRTRHAVKSAAFISNKGGVGKTHISTNMAFYLSRMGKKALLIDLDLSNSDVTSKLGYYCENTIIDLLRGRRTTNHLIYSTPVGFDLIAGEPGNFKLANMTAQQKRKFIRLFRESANDYDFVLYDLSAGLGVTTLDFALAQDYQIIVTTPQDIVAGYSCIKAAFFRFQQLEKKMAERDSAYKVRRTFRPFVVLNQVKSFKAGRELFEKIAKVGKQNLGWDKNFSVDMIFLGVVTSDADRIREAELNRFLYSREYGGSRTGQCINFLVQNLVRYRDPNNLAFTTKLKRFVDIFMRSVEETKYAQ